MRVCVVDYRGDNPGHLTRVSSQSVSSAVRPDSPSSCAERLPHLHANQTEMGTFWAYTLCGSQGLNGGWHMRFFIVA
eukprot:6211137-Pleurochrysis_carterae.AAC.1